MVIKKNNLDILLTLHMDPQKLRDSMTKMYLLQILSWRCILLIYALDISSHGRWAGADDTYTDGKTPRRNGKRKQDSDFLPDHLYSAVHSRARLKAAASCACGGECVFFLIDVHDACTLEVLRRAAVLWDGWRDVEMARGLELGCRWGRG